MTPDCLIKIKPLVNKEVYDELNKALNYGDKKAWDLTLEKSIDDMKLSRRQAIVDANRKSEVLSYIQEQVAKGVKPGRALSDLISGSGSRQGSGKVSLDKYIEGVRGTYVSKLVEGIHKSRPTMLGLRRSTEKEYAKNLTKVIFGETALKTSAEMKAVANAWKNITADLLTRFNKAGGGISKLEAFNIPVNHYAPKISAAKFEKWNAFLKDNFNLERLPQSQELTDDQLRKKIFDSITTEGAYEPDFAAIGERTYKKLGSGHQEHRWLQPKNGSAWIEYNELYGRHGSPIDAMVEYIDGMSTQIGLMETFGTNPMKLMDDIVANMRNTTGDGRAGAMALGALDQIRSRNPGYEDTLSKTLIGLRDFQTATKLGMAPITALSDVMFSTVTAVYNGLNPIKVFTRHLKNLNPANHADRLTAGRLGLLMEYALDKASAVNRFSDSTGYGALHRIADFSTRASGLNHWTNTARTSFGLEFLSNMADYANVHYDKLPRGIKSGFERYGITLGDWQTIRQSISDIKGVKYVDMASQDDVKLTARVIGMVREETNFAVPEPNAKSRAIATANIPTNTLANEMMKVATQFKSFGVSILVSHMGRLMDQSGTANKVLYGSSLLIGSATLGVVVLQLKDIAQGREPRELSPELIGEGFLQGGALGVAGDIVFTNPDLFGGLPAYMVGPTATDFEKLRRVLWGTVTESKSVSEAWSKELFPATLAGAQKASGFATKLWWTRLALDRYALDYVNKLDPAYNEKINNKRKWLREERGQGYWMGPK